MITKRVQTKCNAQIVAKFDDKGWDDITIDANLTLNADDAVQFSQEIDEAVSWLLEQDEKKKKEKEAAKTQERKTEHKSWFSRFWGA
jgi:hypothetical protein